MAGNTLETYAEEAQTPRMRAIAKIAHSRRMTQTSVAASLGLHSSGVRRHFESKAVHDKTVERYIDLLARNDLDRKLIREYIAAVDGRFDAQAAREAVIDGLRAQEPDLREGALPELLAAIEAVDDATLLPALQAYVRMNREVVLSLNPSPFDFSPVGLRLGFAFAAFADAIRGHVDVAAFLDQRQPGEQWLWIFWSHLRYTGAPFTDNDAEAVIALAAGLLLRHGIDPAPMMHHVDRMREHVAARGTPTAMHWSGQSKSNPMQVVPVNQPTKPNERTESMKRSRKRK